MILLLIKGLLAAMADTLKEGTAVTIKKGSIVTFKSVIGNPQLSSEVPVIISLKTPGKKPKETCYMTKENFLAGLITPIDQNVRLLEILLESGTTIHVNDKKGQIETAQTISFGKSGIVGKLNSNKKSFKPKTKAKVEFKHDLSYVRREKRRKTNLIKIKDAVQTKECKVRFMKDVAVTLKIDVKILPVANDLVIKLGEEVDGTEGDTPQLFRSLFTGKPKVETEMEEDVYETITATARDYLPPNVLPPELGKPKLERQYSQQIPDSEYDESQMVSTDMNTGLGVESGSLVELLECPLTDDETVNAKKAVVAKEAAGDEETAGDEVKDDNQEETPQLTEEEEKKLFMERRAELLSEDEEQEEEQKREKPKASILKVKGKEIHEDQTDETKKLVEAAKKEIREKKPATTIDSKDKIEHKKPKSYTALIIGISITALFFFQVIAVVYYKIRQGSAKKSKRKLSKKVEPSPQSLCI